MSKERGTAQSGFAQTFFFLPTAAARVLGSLAELNTDASMASRTTKSSTCILLFSFNNLSSMMTQYRN